MDSEHRPLVDARQDSRTLRSRGGRVLVVVVWAIGLVALGTFVVTGDLLGLGRWAALAALVGYVVWLLFWSPSVTIAPSGVIVRNLLREHAITWPAIQLVDTRFALTLTTTAGRITAWSAPAPSRFGALRASGSELRHMPESTYANGSIRPGDIPQSESGLAALYVRRFWEQLRDAGYLERGVVEGTGVATSWLVREALVLVGLVVLAAACILLVPGSAG